MFITTQAVGQFKVLHLHDSIYSPAVVSQYSYYYLDDTESLTIDGLINKDYSLIFEQKKSLNFDFYTGEVWLKINVINTSEEENWHIDVSHPPLDSIAFYQVDEQGELVAQYLTGDDFYFNQRPVVSTNFIFPVRLIKNVKYTFYAMARSDHSVLRVPFKLLPISLTSVDNNPRELLLGFYFGLLFIASIYAVVTFFLMGVRANLFYGIYVFFVAVFFMTQTGHIYQYLIPNYTQLNNSLPLNGACLSMLFIALFAMDFLELKVNAKTWYYVYVAICAMLLVNLLLQFIDYRLANMLSLYLSGIIFMILLVSSIVLWKKNVPMAGYLIPGWTLYTFGVIIHAMRNLGMIPSHFISDYSLFIATVLEVLVLTVAISINQRKIVLSSIKAKQRSKMRQLKLENERMRAQQLLMENDAINRQLLSVSMESKQQDDLLSSLKNVESEDQLRQKINKLLVKRSVQSNYWENFKTIFETVHPDFFTNIKSVYPQLSSNDLRQLAYAKMHLQVKEIAMLTGVSTQAVKMARNRLKKKIGTNNPLSDFVNHL
ncbi:MAG TPA: 7TM diverse intracellular signaling domain-containing protein [Fulvivirga sp.]|nr:7TM diverse intracellular signaling domain-containing protein [Fulvivirga sp.]